MKNTYYITTPIYYVNDIPHIGHLYTTVAADVLARWNRMQGKDVYFVTGTDEHAQKNAEVALTKHGKRRETEHERAIIQEYVDEMSAKWKLTWDELGISNDDFIRTTEDRHHAGVRKFFEAVSAKGDIYKGKYVGLYCTGCEAYVTESDLVDGKCSIHKKEPKKLEEENYFFKASRYKETLLAHIEAHPEFIQPDARRNEVVRYITDHFDDFSISRQSLSWGIPVPGDTTQVLYVWFDALINYLTTIGYGTDDALFQKYWPADLHLVGKDIIKFHCALWPAMLFSAGIALPKKVFAHGFFTINGQKISKSLGNTIDPAELTQTYSLDAVRYFLLREIPFGEDGDFSIERLSARYDADLANGVGNLTARVVTLAQKYGTRNMEHGTEETELQKKSQETWGVYAKAMEECRFHDALQSVWDYITACDAYLEKNKPWKPDGESESPEVVVANVLEALRYIAWWLWPMMPETAERIFTQCGILKESRASSLDAAKQWGSVTYSVKKGDLLFPRLGFHHKS